MRYLVDGHNLIPKLGLRLDALDDEEALLARLQQFCRLRQAQVEVYFDGAPPGFPPTRKSGAVTAHFVRQGTSADAAIEVRLERLGKQSRNWTVVSSDRRVQNAARAAHSAALSSEEFARQISLVAQQAAVSQREAGLGPEDVEEWLKEFNARKG
jgi:hypothetical protein